ncbi:MAG: glycosyltransferase [Planctomycetota bacterium]|nr:glycosyltransferase [Planctomycetota bacterium]
MPGPSHRPDSQLPPNPSSLSRATGVRVGVVLPVYNESKLIHQTFDAVLNFAATHPDYHFVFADDGSRDGTADMLRQRIARSGTKQVSLLAFPENRGKGRTVADAIFRSPGEVVCFTDGDLAYSLDHLPLLAESLERHDVAIGSRSLIPGPEKNTKLARRVLGWGFNRLARVIVGLPYRDTQAGLKGFRREAARQIFSRQLLGDFSFDVEAVFLAHKLGYRVGEIPARVSEAHSYKASKVNLLSDPLKMFVNLVRIRMMSLRGLYD